MITCTGREVYFVCDRFAMTRCFNALDSNGAPLVNRDGKSDAWWPRHINVAVAACSERPRSRSLLYNTNEHFWVYKHKNFDNNSVDTTKGTGRCTPSHPSPHNE